MVDLEQPQKEVMREFNIMEAILLDGRYIDPKKTGKIDSVSLVQAIKKYFPKKNATGLGLLDLEDENYEALKTNAGKTVSFDKALVEMIRLVRIAKNERPNVLWSVYNIPFTTYYDKNEDWAKQGVRLKPLFEIVDIFTPALYDYYPDTTSFANDSAYVTDNLKIALAEGRKYKKPVMPYIWHRWHDSNAINGLKLINQDEFKKHINTIFNIKFQNNRIAGLIWFGAQSYFHKIKPGLVESDLNKVGGQVEKIKENTLRLYAEYLMEATGTLKF
jgi:hypothetical protein